MQTADISAPSSVQPALAQWFRVITTAALALTALDAILLQKSKAFFTGGFLSAQHTSGPVEAVAFLLVSLLADAGIAGTGGALAAWATSRASLTRTARSLVILLGAVSPLVFMNFVDYRLLQYLGDAFDLGLMFELTGRRPGELFAVASWQLLDVTLLAAGTAAGAVALMWSVNRYGPGKRAPLTAVPRRLPRAAGGLFLVGVIATLVASAASETFEDGLRRKPSGRVFVRLIESLTDVDRDGYGIGGPMRDPDPFDASVSPYALDVPGNGVDENGVGGDLPADGHTYVEGVPTYSGWKQRPNIVFFVLESFRADILGRTIDGRPVTPVLDALARRGVSSSMAFSHNGYTAQSRFHLFSGSLAGLRNGRTLIDDFAAKGYETAYFSAQDESFGGAALGVGFDRAEVAYDARRDRDRRYSTFSTPGSLAVPYTTLAERVGAFVATRDSSRPLFLYVNFHDTHYPYHHDKIRPLVSPIVLPQSRIEPLQWRALHEMYLNTAANVDDAVGSVLERVTRALPGPPAVILTADHGESLFDENFLGHGYALNDVQTRIPLIVSGLPMEIGEPVGQADLRDAIGAALSMEPSDTPIPRLSKPPGKVVLQYLGNIDRPRQIAFATGSSRTIYDFRRHRVLVGGTSAWREPDELEGDERAQLLRLVHYWERMMLARAGR